MSTGDEEDSGKKPRLRRAGMTHDARGNAVWQWAVDSGRHLKVSTSQLLKRLEVPGLKLEEDANTQGKTRDAKSGAPANPKGGAGYDPYGHKRVAPTLAARPAAVRPTARKPAAAPRPRRSWWQRLFRRD